MQESNAILGGLLNVMHPELYRQARDGLIRLSEHPNSIRNGEQELLLAALRTWTNPFSALQVILNRETPLHRDVRGRKNWYDMLVTLGNYTNGRFELPGIGLRLNYPPGTVIGICSMALMHGAGKVNGDRICLAYFMRNKVLERLGICAGNWPKVGR
jgi:hypothetical protein